MGLDSPIEERARYDDFELEDNYDFNKCQVPYLKKYAAEKHIAYQTLINSLLRKSIEKGLKS